MAVFRGRTPLPEDAAAGREAAQQGTPQGAPLTKSKHYLCRAARGGQEPAVPACPLAAELPQDLAEHEICQPEEHH